YDPRVEQTKCLLTQAEVPRRWNNVRADLPSPMQPILHPGTGQPVGPDDLAPLFPMELILQEVSEEPEIAIPDEVLELYSLWRPTPLYRAHRLEQAAGTRSRIFYKYEGVSPAGSHKPNTAIAEAVEDAGGRADTAYSLGSVLGHVLLHQTVIGQEALRQMELAGAFPDLVVGCFGGGSNFAGLAFPFLREKLAGREVDLLAC